MQIRRKKIKTIELTYHTVSAETVEVERRLQQAYDVLFENVLKQFLVTDP